MTIKQEYQRALKAAAQRRKYYMDLYGLALPEIKKTKRPTRASVRRLKKLYRGGEAKVSKVALRYYKRHKDITPSPEPITIEEVVVSRISDILRTAKQEAAASPMDGRAAWMNWKVEEFEKRLRETNKSLEELEKLIPNLDAQLERFIYDSTNARDSAYMEFLNMVDSVIFGIDRKHGVRYDFYDMLHDIGEI